MIDLIGPEWAHGCEACTCGIVAAPDLLGALPFYEGRAGQAGEGLIIFCTCKAGHLYRQHLRRIYNGLSMETRRNILTHIEAASTPTVHA